MSRKPTTPTGSGDSHLGPLIDRLGPINNAARAADGVGKVELLWDLGEAILAAYPQADDSILWAISARSYITRDLLRYALIVRRAWTDRAAFRETFPRLTQYALFREALPFLKGERCGIDDDTYQDIVARLNGKGRPGEVKEFLLSLKSKKVGRKHRKGQAKARMTPVAEPIRAGVQAAFTAAVAGGEAVATIRLQLGDGWLLRLAQWFMAAADDTTFEPTPDGSGLPEPFSPLAAALAQVGVASREDRAGFRKAVGVPLLMDGADLFNALRSDEQLKQWRLRRKARLRV
jgi:hypothetical protein